MPLKTISVHDRLTKVSPEHLARTPEHMDITSFMESLPDFLAAKQLKLIIQKIRDAREKKRTILLMMGGHMVKVGISPLINRLIQDGYITHLACNGSVAIHDYELAVFGGTSEDVQAGLIDGTFGMVRETGERINAIVAKAASLNAGYGQRMACYLQDKPLSVIGECDRSGIGCTIHSAIATETVHQHKDFDGSAWGKTSAIDFHILSDALIGLHDGGVVLNFGSAVIMPEIFLKALTISRNINDGKPTGFLAADFDMIRQYRPRVNVVERPTMGNGVGIQITGHHEIMFPLLAWALLG